MKQYLYTTVRCLLGVLLLLPGIANPEEGIAFLSLSFDKGVDSCEMIEFGGALKRNYFEFDGRKDANNKLCVVRIPEDQFSKYFRFCSLASLGDQHGFGKCFIQPYTSSADKGYAFYAGIIRNTAGVGYQKCDFVCLSKESGNRIR